MSGYKYTVFFEPLEEGGYNVVVPAFPEVCTFGSTLEEARQMAVDAIKCTIEAAKKAGEPIPDDVTIEQQPIKEKLSIAI